MCSYTSRSARAFESQGRHVAGGEGTYGRSRATSAVRLGEAKGAHFALHKPEKHDVQRVQTGETRDSRLEGAQPLQAGRTFS
jgi:hypothetical protein